MASNLLYLVRLDSIRKNSHGADGKIADFILTNARSLHHYTVQSLADETATSYASVCRFLKKLGAGGFKELKKVLSEELSDESHMLETLEFNIESDRHVPFDQIAKRICDYSSGVVSGCYKIFHKEEIERIVGVIRGAEHIQFIGLGASAVTAQYAYTKFFRLRHNCSFDTDIIVAKMKATMLQSKNVLFAISSSGRTQSILDIAELARASGATVISICDFLNSPLANRSDISICTTVRESNKYIDVDFPLIQGQITIIDIIYAYLYNRMPEVSSYKLKKTKEAVSRDKTRQ